MVTFQTQQSVAEATSRAAAMTITLRQLEIFLALAEHEHVGRASEALNLSPSATSSALLALEAAVGRSLFDRSGRGLRLNADGRRFRGAARATLTQAHEAESLLRDEQSGQLVVGASTTIANHVLAPILATFIDSHPLAVVRLEVGNTHDILDRLLHFAVDLAYVEGPTAHPDILATPWRTDRLVIFVACDHPLARKGRIDVADLSHVAWILREQGSGTREVFMRALEDDAARISTVLELGSSEAVARAVGAGGGVGCLSQLVVRRDLEEGRLIELDTPDWNFQRTMWRLTHRDLPESRLASAFAAALPGVMNTVDSIRSYRMDRPVHRAGLDG